MVRAALLVSTIIVVLAVASCGGQSTSSRSRAHVDADAGDGQSEAGTFACGDAFCSPSQICLTPAYGCVVARLPDAGPCLDGSQYSDASGSCLQYPPPPSCVYPAPTEGSFDCSGGDAGAACSTVNAPIPSSCSHICRAICG
jgi:hypothetical protein